MVAVGVFVPGGGCPIFQPGWPGGPQCPPVGQYLVSRRGELRQHLARWATHGRRSRRNQPVLNPARGTDKQGLGGKTFLQFVRNGKRRNDMSTRAATSQYDSHTLRLSILEFWLRISKYGERRTHTTFEPPMGETSLRLLGDVKQNAYARQGHKQRRSAVRHEG